MCRRGYIYSRKGWGYVKKTISKMKANVSQPRFALEDLKFMVSLPFHQKIDKKAYTSNLHMNLINESHYDEFYT